MGSAKKLALQTKEKKDVSLSELLKEFNPTIEEHIKSVDSQVSEILMGRCPPGTRPTTS